MSANSMEASCPKCGRQLMISSEDAELQCQSCKSRYTRAKGDTVWYASDLGETVTFIAETTPPNSDGADANPAETYATIPGYKVLNVIAKGGMGVVYRACQESLNRIVALKTIRSQTFGDEQLQRFQSEGEAAAKLEHDGIVAIYDFGEHQGQPYLSMAYIDGGSLEDRARDCPLSPADAAEVIAAVADAIEHAHTRDIIHRDLKPQNILLGPNGKPRVADFGLAKLVQADADLTATGQILGTPSYMAPEQASGRPAERASDIWAIGATLYRILVGRPPFQASTTLETLRQITESDPAPPRRVNPDIPRDLETICLKCLQKQLVDRYASAAEVAADLRRWQNNQPIHARRPSFAKRLTLWCRRNRWSAISAAVISLLLILSGTTIAIMQHVNQQRLDEEQTASAKRAADSGIDAVLNAPPSAVPYAFERLMPLQRHAVPKLHARLKTGDADEHRLRLAYCLGRFGEPDEPYLTRQLIDAPASEFGNVLQVLEPIKQDALQTIRDLVPQFDEERDWRNKGILAMAALQLGDSTVASAMCLPSKDLTQRTEFIEAAIERTGDLLRLANYTKQLADEDELFAVMCQIAGSVLHDQTAHLARGTWIDIWQEAYQNSPSSGTHSAASWALRHCGVELPEIERTVNPSNDRQWHINGLGITMIVIPPGEFERYNNDTPEKQRVQLTRELLISDREIPVEIKSLSRNIGQLSKPLVGVYWLEAATYCNRISEQEGLPMAYVPTGETKQIRSQEFDVLTLDPDSTGYRLPTEAEWEYAVRAGTETQYYIGNLDKYLDRYAVVMSSNAGPCGSKLPNCWGLFDIHGNAWEWCNDLYAGYGFGTELSVVNPLGSTTGQSHVLRGGAYYNRARVTFCGNRIPFDEQNLSFIGFRIARTRPVDE